MLILSLCAVLTNGLCSADDVLVWRLGDCDNNYAEFAIAGQSAVYAQRFEGGVRFEVGKSDPKEDWPFIQPGPVDAWAGTREHSQEVVFDLDAGPSGVYVLEIDLVDSHGSYLPVVVVGVNKRVQEFELAAGAGDMSLSDPTKGREQVMRMYLVASDLHKGKNTITITTVKGSWVLYDCISLSACITPPKTVQNLSLGPTFLFKNTKDGLRQIVNASMDLWCDHKSIRTLLTSDKGLHFEQIFANVGAGRRKLQIEVPELESEHQARLTVFAGNEVFEADGVIRPVKHWTIYLMPSTHFDIGYTSIQDKAMEVHRDNLDKAMDWCRKYPDFIWNLEGSRLAEDYLEKGPRPDEFVRLAKQGRIGVMGFYGNELTGACSSEGLVRLLDCYDWLRRRQGISTNCVMQTDVPTMVATVPMILRGHGIRYLSHGTNTVRARPDQALYNTPHYWQSPDGSKVLVWRTPGYGQCSQVTGVGAGDNLAPAERAVVNILSGYEARTDYPYDAILLHGAYGDNQPNASSLAAIPDRWNRLYAYPKLVLCRGEEFFEHIESGFAKHIPTVKGDQGGWWEDGIGSSARETTITRRAKEQLLTAEKLTVLCDADFQNKVSGKFADAWKNVLLYDEHTWGAAQSISEPESEATRGQWAVKKSFADRAHLLASGLLRAAKDMLCEDLAAEDDCVMVFNPSSWARGGTVHFTTEKGENGAVYAGSVPPLGYKLIPLSKCLGYADTPAQGDVLENDYYIIRFDKNTGAIASIFDKQLERELVEPSDYGFNSYLYATGGEDARVLHFHGSATLPEIKIDSCSNARLSKYSRPGRRIMRATSDAPNAKAFRSEVILYDDRKRIDFVNHIDKTENLAKEAGYFAFPFALKDPKIGIEIPNGVIRADADQVQGACRDWYAAQHFVTIADENAAVAWTAVDSPLVTLQDINRGQWHDRLDIKNGKLFAYVFNNYWFTNYKASQGGPHTFRFAMTSARTISDLEAKRFGESVQSPVVCQVVDGRPGAGGPYSRSFVEVSGDGVVVQAMKPARFADGTIVRLREMGGRAATVDLTIRGIEFEKAYLCNLAEDTLQSLEVDGGVIRVPCDALGLVTVLLAAAG